MPETAIAPELETAEPIDEIVDETLVDETLVDETLVEEVSIDGMCGVY